MKSEFDTRDVEASDTRDDGKPTCRKNKTDNAGQTIALYFEASDAIGNVTAKKSRQDVIHQVNNLFAGKSLEDRPISEYNIQKEHLSLGSAPLRWNADLGRNIDWLDHNLGCRSYLYNR